MDAEIHDDAEIYVVPRSRIIASNIPYDEYLTGKYGRHVEWVYGTVIAMAPINIQHHDISLFLSVLFDVYVSMTTGGRMLCEPMVMKPTPDLPGRQPDIQILLPDRMHLLKENQVAGAASLVVEIVSPGTEDTDRGAKFREYELGGVEEYWILDPRRKEPLFYVLNEEGLYQSRAPVDGIYISKVLPKLKLPIALLWQDKLPSTGEIVKLVEDMLKE
jgi:Uma2 family endonuclease